MWHQRYLVTLTAAVLLHTGLAYSLSRFPSRIQKAPQVVELEVKGSPLPPPAPPAPSPLLAPEPPPLAPSPRRKAVVKRRAPSASRSSARSSARPPAASPPPVVAPTRPLFGVTMDSLTDGPSSVSVPLGESTTADPRAPREGSGPPAPPVPPTERPYVPVSSLAVKIMPEIDSEACGRGITYPQEARALGIEGDVILRVELDDKGEVRRVRVVSGLGHGLDQAAVAALKRTCKFTPAFDSAGQPVAYIIPAYTFHFELPR